MSDYVSSYRDRRSAGGLLVTSERVAALDLERCIGQRQATFRFDLIDGRTGENLDQVYPVMDTPAAITHDVSRTIKRDLRLTLESGDVSQINTLTDRILPSMVLADRTWPLGRFMFTSEVDAVSTAGDDASLVLMDEMWLVDQEIDRGFTSTKSVDQAIVALLAGLPLRRIEIEASPYPAVGGWRVGSRRGQITGALSTLGDYETPWLDNAGTFRMIRTVDPAAALPAITWDDTNLVLADGISKTDNLIESPNRFVVVGNGTASAAAPIVGTYDVPPSAPHSIANRGFAIQQTTDLGVKTQAQATAAARALGIRQTVVEQLDATTPPDPRFDGYDIVRWRGVNWLSVSWSMTLAEGGGMSHALRRGFTVV